MRNLDNITPALRRVRHDFKARHLMLQSREQITPNFVCLTLAGELRDFVSEGFDDHFKLILPQAGQEKPNLPQMVDSRLVLQEPRPIMRDYTPLRWTENTLTVGVALHDNGPATEWARTAALGSWVGVAGPRGSMVIAEHFRSYWLFADTTGLPAVERLLAQLPAQATVTVRLQAPEEDRRDLFSAAALDLQWVDGLCEAAQSMQLPAEPHFIWAAGESAEMKLLRELLVAKGASVKQMRVAAYWKLGSQAHHEELSAESI